MSSNSDLRKKAQEVIFSSKITKTDHPNLSFSESTASQSASQKHLGVIFDSSLSLDKYLISVQSKTSKTIGLLRKLLNTLPRKPFMTICKAFIRPELDYCGILYEQAYNTSFHQKLERIQYNAWHFKRETLPTLGLESLEKRRWLRKLYLFLKTFKSKSLG